MLFNRINAFANSILLGKCETFTENVIRWASKKAGGSSKNRPRHRRAKHRRIHYQDGEFVQKGTLLITQNKFRCHPGLNVGYGRNLTLYALQAGRILVTCEKIDPNLDGNQLLLKTYGGRNLDNVYKKYFHIIPPPQHYRFKLVE